jgi:hypothetical protein
MQQPDYLLGGTKLTGSSPAVANAALDYFAPITETRPLDNTAFISTARHDRGGPKDTNEPRIKAEIETVSTSPLPSLLQYVDHVLMRHKAQHNKPPHPAQKCTICSIQWDKASIPSTFLTLSPCGHWVHYRCLIELATHGGPHKGSCNTCNTPFYEWDGINTLMLAGRTNVPIQKDQTTAISSSTYALVASDRDAYEQECDFIEKTIERRFFKQLAKPSGFADHSPDLVQCFNDVLNDLRLMGRPTSKWLTWSTTTGSLLFGMLVAIKMQRYLTEGHGRLKQTEAWVAWAEGCRALQARILDDVHQEQSLLHLIN